MSMRTLTFSREEFAADRRPILERAAEALRPAVEAALDSLDWETLATTVHDYAVFVAREEGVEVPSIPGFRERILETLRLTEPDGTTAQVDRIAEWLGTAAVNAGTMEATARDDEVLVLEWVTMHDDSVRGTHRAVDGDQALPGETFTVAGYELHYPGEPVGPPAVWINCRCVLRPAMGDEMGNRTSITADGQITDEQDDIDEIDDVETEEDEDEILFSEDAWDGLETEVPWHGVLAPVDTMSGDRRKFAPGSITYRDLPLPLKWMPSDKPGHDDSVPVGNIEYAEERDGLIYGGGMFRDGDEDAANAIDQVATSVQRGISVDLDAAAAEYQDDDGNPFDFEQEYTPGAVGPIEVLTEGRLASATLCAIPAFQEAWISLGREEDEPGPSPSEEFARLAGADCEPCEALALVEANSVEHARELGAMLDATPTVPTEFTTADGTRYRFDAEGVEVFAPGTKDGPGWITHPRETQRLRTYWTRGKGAAKIRWGAPGDFNRCRRNLAKYVQNPSYLAGMCANLHKVALGIWPGQHRGKTASGSPDRAAYNLVAAAAPPRPGEWFQDPGLGGPTPITVTEDGRVYGHLATWGTCHVGIPGTCVTPPESKASYGYFTTGAVLTDSGEVAVGQITMNTGHASLRAGASAAMAHYDNTGTAVADVAAGEDGHGIWIAGALRPGVTEEQAAALRGAALSGDWRDIRGNLELVAALAVNVPGFPIPRMSIAASAGHQTTLVASGILSRDEQQEPVKTEPVSVEAIVAAAIKEMRAAERREQQAAALREQVAREQKARLRQEVGL